MSRFVGTSIKSIDSTGMIVSSSKYLVRKVLSGVNFNKDMVIVEFGTGNGCVTQEILGRMSPNSVLISYELLEEFYNYALEHYSHDPRLHLFNHDARLFPEDMKKLGLTQLDVVVSSLPLSLMNAKLKDYLLHEVAANLTEKGMFIQYQYSFFELLRMRRFFNSVSLKFTPLNLPPAFVYQCQNLSQ